MEIVAYIVVLIANVIIAVGRRLDGVPGIFDPNAPPPYYVKYERTEFHMRDGTKRVIMRLRASD